MGPVIKLSGDRAIPSLKHGPDVRKEGIIAARISPHPVNIRGRPVKFGPVRILEADASIGRVEDATLSSNISHNPRLGGRLRVSVFEREPPMPEQHQLWQPRFPASLSTTSQS